MVRTLASKLLVISSNPSKVSHPYLYPRVFQNSINLFTVKFPWITYSDLWTLAGVCAIQEMQGPTIPWRPGRTDRDVSMCTPEQSHLRAIFGRMGFDDREIVALSGAHALGRCHTDRSGYDGPWSFSPTVMSNDYYRLLMQEKWNWRKVWLQWIPAIPHP